MALPRRDSQQLQQEAQQRRRGPWLAQLQRDSEQLRQEQGRLSRGLAQSPHHRGTQQQRQLLRKRRGGGEGHKQSQRGTGEAPLFFLTLLLEGGQAVALLDLQDLLEAEELLPAREEGRGVTVAAGDDRRGNSPPLSPPSLLHLVELRCDAAGRSARG